jgi:hypothetical protein
MRHYLTYQHNIQQFLRNHVDKYDGVIIPLSIATSFPSATYGFVRALCSRNPDKQYAVDPRNALFQKAWDRTNVREPHIKMAAALGEPFSVGLTRPLVPEDFAAAEVLSNVVKKCLDFQTDFRSRKEDKRKLEKYKKLLGISTLGDLGNPQFLIPPYFQSSNNNDPWFEVSIRAIADAMNNRGPIPVRPVLHFQKWSEMEWTDCHARLVKTGVREFWFYPNNFREHEAELEELRAYRDAVALASTAHLISSTLFGGYFAILMSYFGLSGFGNGIGYGEWRASGYHRGGSAITRVYSVKLHRFLDAPTLQSLIGKEKEYFGYDTDILAGYVDSGTSLTEMSLNECLDHFMECRKQELDFVNSSPRPTAAAELSDTVMRLKRIGPIEMQRLGTSLTAWENVIR